MAGRGAYTTTLAAASAALACFVHYRYINPRRLRSIDVDLGADDACFNDSFIHSSRFPFLSSIRMWSIHTSLDLHFPCT